MSDYTMISEEDTAKFNIWFNENWLESKGLINKSTAARIIGVSPQYIKKLVDNNQLKSFSNEYEEFLSLEEVKTFKINRDAKRKLKENQK